ncbi:MAG: prepilin-type N-terminal cleavage/methylation domain-containing protein [Thermodesulfobacteriota bacterium]
MRTRRPFGFTLVEVIVAVVILAAAAAMAGLFASTSMGRGAAGTLSFNDEVALRNALEDITIYYKGQIAAGSMTLPGVAAYVNANHAGLVNDARTGYLSFSDPDADKVYTPSAVTDTYSAGLTLLVTLTSGDQSLGSLFTE